MAKPKQMPFISGTSGAELQEALESAMLDVESAMRSLRGEAAFAELFDALGALWDGMNTMLPEYEAAAAEEYAQYLREMNREYEHSVL